MEAAKIKKVIRRNLPINDKYVLIDSFYTSMENGTCCDNCNKIIANIAVIKNEANKVFHVGLDCAETLTHLQGLLGAQMQFTEAKGIRAKVNKGLKNGQNITFENTCKGEIVVKFNENSRLWLNREFVSKYLPDYFNKITNPEKNNFKPVPEANFCTYTSKETSEAREFYRGLKAYQFNDFTINVFLREGEKMDGTPNGSWLFCSEVMKGGKKLSERSTYMVKDLNSQINYQLNTILFNQF